MIFFEVQLLVFYLRYQENKEEEKTTNFQDSLFSKKTQQDYLIWKW